MAGGKAIVAIGLALWMMAFGLAERGAEANRQTLASKPLPAALHFETSDNCLACHNSLTAPSGEDVSIGSAWRGR